MGSDAFGKDAPLISVLIPAFNEERFLGPTLAGVRESFEALGRTDYEIVVCDNNSTDRTAAVADAGGARMVFEPHNQISRARNTAARSARGNWFIFLDADTTPGPDLLAATLRRLETGRIGGGGALVRLDTERPGWFGTVFRWSWNRLSVIRKLAPGSFLYCQRRAWEETGGFDEELYYFEDIFFSKKLKRWCRSNGLRVSIITEAQVLTSSRKLQWYSGWQLTRQLLRAFIPNSIRHRENWDVCYDPSRGKRPSRP